MADNGLESSGAGGNELLILDGQEGYIYNVATGNFTQVDRTARGYVSAVTVTEPGSGFTSLPTATVEGGVGTSATIINGGTGYATGDILYVEGGLATSKLSFTITSVSTSGAILATDLLSNGEYTTFPNNPVATSTDGAGYGATAHVRWVEGAKLKVWMKLVDATLVGIGSGYNIGDSVALSANSNSTPAYVTVLTTGVSRLSPDAAVGTTGSGYNVGDTLTVVGGVFDTVATAVVATVDGSGGITSATVTNAGAYTTFPTQPLSFTTNGGGTSASLNAEWSIGSIEVQSGGKYDSIPYSPLYQQSGSTASSAVAVAGGSGYVVGEKINVPGGTSTTQAVFTVATIDGSGAILTLSVLDAGSYTAFPTNPVAVTSSGSGMGATINISWSSGAGISITPSWGVEEVEVIESGRDYPNSAYVVFAGGDQATPAKATPTISINNGGFPLNPVKAAFIDGYFVVINGTMSAWSSDLYDGLTYNPLATSPLSSTSDNVYGVLNHMGQLLFIKSGVSEIWYNAGTATSQGFPFAKMQGGTLPAGSAYQWAIAQGSGSVFALATQKQGENPEFVFVVQLSGYTPNPISTSNINYLIDKWPKINAFSYVYSEHGHTFYVVTDPDADATLAYDVTSGMWHERSSFREGIAPDTGRHVSDCYVYHNGKHYIGDYRNGNIYEMSSDYFSDNGDNIISTRIGNPIYDKGDMDNVFISSFQVDFETGTGDFSEGFSSDPKAMLYWSDDGGHTFSDAQQATVGKLGDYITRLIWWQCGYGRVLVPKLSISDQIRKIVLNAYLDI